MRERENERERMREWREEGRERGIFSQVEQVHVSSF